MKSINTNILPKVSSSPPQIYWSLPYHYKFSSHQRIVQTGHSHDACTPPWQGKSCLSDNILVWDCNDCLISTFVQYKVRRHKWDCVKHKLYFQFSNHKNKNE